MEWTRGPTVGRGSFATVSLATTASGELFAVKSCEFSRSTFLQREQHILSQLNSPYIVEYMGFDITYENMKPMYNLFMEYVAGGTLSDVVKRRGGSLDEATIRLYTRQILHGLDYLHSNRLVHCDIKGQNVLIGKDGAKIADFGCARLVEDGVAAATSALSGTPVFMAPEVARGEEQGFPADMWALGCTLIEMATGSNPWPDLDDPVSALYRIGHSGDVPEFPRWLSAEGKDFVSKCLKRDAKERWTVKQLLQHPFLHNLESEFEQVGEFQWISPTTVLDRGFWDSVEASERNPTHGGSSSNSPAERIGRLIGATFSAGPNLPNWTDEEDWISVRSNHTEEKSLNFSGHNCDINSTPIESVDEIKADNDKKLNTIVTISFIVTAYFSLSLYIEKKSYSIKIKSTYIMLNIYLYFLMKVLKMFVCWRILNFDKQINNRLCRSIQLFVRLCIFEFGKYFPAKICGGRRMRD